IVPDELWIAAHERLRRARRVYLEGTGGAAWGRPTSGIDSKYLLTGLGVCGRCDGSIHVRSRSHGQHRRFSYGCMTNHLRGARICTNTMTMPLDLADSAVLAAVRNDVLRPDIVDLAVRIATERLQPDLPSAAREHLRLQTALREIARELERLTAAIVAG